MNNTQKITAIAAKQMMPANVQEISNQAIKYLSFSRSKLPQPNFHAILAPYQEWSKSGHILGDAIAHLNFPDNSVLFLSEIDSDDGLILPPINSSIVLPHSTALTNQILVDNKILTNISNNIPNTRSDISIFEHTSAPFIGMPFVIEAARIRKRGLPLCTPILFGKNCDKAKLTLELQKIIETQGVGVVIMNNSLNYSVDSNNKEIVENVGMSFLPEIFSLFFNENYAGLTIMTYLAHKFKTSLDIVSSGRYLEEDNIFEEMAIGISKNKTYDNINFNNINLRKNIWCNVLNSLKDQPFIPLEYNGSILIELKDNLGQVFYQKLSFDLNQDMGLSIWEASHDIFSDFSESDTASCFIEITFIINPEKLLNNKSLNRVKPENYDILIQGNDIQNISVQESIVKTINNFQIDINKAYIYKPFKITLPLDVLLLLHDINYS